jgi:REP element-mobilizing transposase RayT
MYHVTYMCVDRMFLLKPSPDVNSAVGSSLGRALASSPVILHSATTNINHLELIISIGKGQVNNASRFLRDFGGLTARSINAVHGREGPVWSGRARVEEIKSDKKAEKLLGYGACNTVKDGLVEKARDWTGFSTTDALSNGKDKLIFDYIDKKLFFKSGADHRKDVDPADYIRRTLIPLTPIPSWQKCTAHQRAAKFRDIIEIYEKAAAKERLAEGILTVKGISKIKIESPFLKPLHARKRTAQPLCHVDTKTEYLQYQKWHLEICQRHKEASFLYREGCFEAEFPPGTFRPPLVVVYDRAV